MRQAEQREDFCPFSKYENFIIAFTAAAAAERDDIRALITYRNKLSHIRHAQRTSDRECQLQTAVAR